MKPKSLLLPLALFVAFPSMAWDDLYLIGEGTPTGWSLDNAIRLDEVPSTGSNVWETVCFIDNATGSSFRVQPFKEWNGQYYGAASQGEPIGDGQSKPITLNNENTFKVASPGVYRIKADLNQNMVTVSRVDAVYVVGSVKDHAWAVDRYAPLSRLSDQSDVYEGSVALDEGDFKIAVNPTDGNYDGRLFLFRNGKSEFVTNDGQDSKWTVGYPDQSTHEEKDLDPGTYRLTLDMARKTIKFTRQPQSVSLAGGAVGQEWNTWGGLAMNDDGNNEFVSDHVFFRNDNVFKPVVDGKYYGSSSWETTTLTDGDAAYLRNVDVGGDLKVASDGFRHVRLFPSHAGDGTLGIIIGQPQTPYYEGWCTLSYNQADRYFHNDDYRWIDAGQAFAVKLGDDEVGRVNVQESGWYSAYAPVDGATVGWQAVRQPVILYVDDKEVTFGSTDLSENGYLKNAVMIDGGSRVSASIGSRRSGVTTVGSAGYYCAEVRMTADGGVDLSLRGPIAVNMPLKESDFAGGKKHYFLVGQRMGAWRLQPEWEFLPNGDGSYSIPSRLLYNGYVMVGVVDNYADYIAQTYKGFTDPATDRATEVDPRNNREDITRSYALAAIGSSGRNGCADGKFTSVRYNEIDRTNPVVQHGCDWDGLRLKLINVLSADGGGTQADLQSLPSRVNSIVLTVDGIGDPVSLTFNGLNTKPIEVAKLRTFSLVGGGINNQKVHYDKQTATTPLNHQPGYGTDAESIGWADAWIQYDKKQSPYVDVYGEFIYQTSFTENWLKSHPSYFCFGDQFEYNSNNITFTYSPESTHDDQFGRRTFKAPDGKTDHREVLITYSNDAEGKVHGSNDAMTETNLDDMISVPEARRACFVVEDMWMEGLFKVWAGWGGSATNYEYEENGTNFTRWFKSNAGHGAWRDDRAAFYSAKTEMVFTLFEDMDAANFGIGYGDLNSEKVTAEGSIKEEYKTHPERRFFKRVEIWFDLDNNFSYKTNRASFLRFIQEQGAPAIYISRQEGSANKLQYTYHIPLANGVTNEIDHTDFGPVTYYRIERIPRDENGVEGAPVLVEEKNINTNRDNFGDPEGKIYFADDAELAPGRYRYQITTRREKTGSEEKTAKSNIITITDDGGASTGIENVGIDAADGFEMEITLDAIGIMMIKANDEIGVADVYSVNGSLVRRTDVSGNYAEINMSSLPAGIYIVKAHDKAKRIIKR